MYSRFEGTGVGFLVNCANLKRLLNEKIFDFEGVSSSNNKAILDCITALGHKLKSIQYIFIKHTDQQSNVRTKIIELLKDIKPELDNGMPDSFDVVALVAAMQKEFGISIKGRDITPENFSTVDGITALLERYGVADEV